MDRTTDTAQLRTCMRGNIRKTRIDRILSRVLLHEAFDATVFKRMKTDHAQPAAICEHRERSVQRLIDLFEFLIHLHTNGLERTSGRMLARLSRWDCARDNLCELERASDGSGVTRIHDGASYAFCESLLTVLADDAGNLMLWRFRKPVSSSHTSAVVHAHVERSVLRKAETTRCIIELRRRNAEIEQHTIESPPHPHPRRALREPRERALDQLQSPCRQSVTAESFV